MKPFAGRVATETKNFVSLIVKTIFSWFALTLSTPSVAKTQCFVHLSFNSTFEILISGDLQTLLRYFSGKAVVAFSIIPFTAAGLPIYVILYYVILITLLELVASSLEKKP